jgi:Na+-translocating ferredoxin:NAD+ oxidoreductase RnfD subunit
MTAMARSAADAARLGGLRRFAVSISAFNVLGHAFFGFEQSWAQPLVGIGTAYATEIVLEIIDARLSRRRTRFSGGWRNFVDCLLSAHISGLAVAMLLFPSDRLMPVAFASALAIASKAMVVTRVNGGRRHVLNPSNLGVTATLLLFPSVGIAPPYHFFENLAGAGGWILTVVICVTGGLLNARFTRRLPLIAAWVVGFAAQAVVRTGLAGTPLVPALLPITGVAFVVYSMYMITDPATSPPRPSRQIAFGLSVAAVYSALTAAHVVYGLFYALTAVCLARGVGIHLLAVAAARAGRATIRPAAEPLVG